MTIAYNYHETGTIDANRDIYFGLTLGRREHARCALPCALRPGGSIPFVPATSWASTLRDSWSLGRMPAGHESERHVARDFWHPTVAGQSARWRPEARREKTTRFRALSERVQPPSNCRSFATLTSRSAVPLNKGGGFSARRDQAKVSGVVRFSVAS